MKSIFLNDSDATEKVKAIKQIDCFNAIVLHSRQMYVLFNEQNCVVQCQYIFITVKKQSSWWICIMKLKLTRIISNSRKYIMYFLRSVLWFVFKSWTFFSVVKLFMFNSLHCLTKHNKSKDLVIHSHLVVIHFAFLWSIRRSKTLESFLFDASLGLSYLWLFMLKALIIFFVLSDKFDSLAEIWASAWHRNGHRKMSIWSRRQLNCNLRWTRKSGKFFSSGKFINI